MKKLLATTLFSLALTPTLGLANLFDHLVQMNVGAGVCGYPPASNANFCGCFMGEAVTACKAHGIDHGIPPLACTEQRIKTNIKVVHDDGMLMFCKNFSSMMPTGVTGQECAEDLTYVKYHC